jgi:hypothetical protein
LDISLIDVDIKPEWITITIKDKILQLNTNHQISPDKSICERNKITGMLSITMLKINVEGGTESIRNLERIEFENLKKDEMISKIKDEEAIINRNRRYENCLDSEQLIDYKNIISKNINENTSKNGVNFKIQEKITREKICDEQFIDDPSVPPLC